MGELKLKEEALEERLLVCPEGHKVEQKGRRYWCEKCERHYIRRELYSPERDCWD